MAIVGAIVDFGGSGRREKREVGKREVRRL